MEKIPTAEEFFEQGGTYPELAIEFAKRHLKAQQKAIINNIELKTFYDPEEERPYEAIDENSIINAYPLDNVK